MYHSIESNRPLSLYAENKNNTMQCIFMQYNTKQSDTIQLRDGTVKIEFSSEISDTSSKCNKTMVTWIK